MNGLNPGPMLQSPDGTKLAVLSLDNATGALVLDAVTDTAPVHITPMGTSNAVRSDRVVNTAYQISAVRPAAVTVNFTLAVASGQSGYVALQVGPDSGSMVEQARRELGVISGGSITGVIGAVLSVIVTTTDKGALRSDVPPGHMWRVVTGTTGGATASLNYVKERIF